MARGHRHTLWARAASVAVALVVGVGATAAPAFAAIYTGHASDPADGTVAATDVRRITETVDTSAANWDITVTFRGAATRSTQAKMYLSFSTVGTNTCGSHQGGFVELTLHGARVGSILRDSCFGGTPGAPTVAAKREGRRLSVRVSDPKLANLVPVAAAQTRISYHTRVQDLVSPFALPPN